MGVKLSLKKKLRLKIMAVNISYKNGLVFKKNSCYITAFTYSDVNCQPPISESLKPNTSLHDETFLV